MASLLLPGCKFRSKGVAKQVPGYQWTQEFRAEIVKVVDDPQRAQQLLRLTSQLELDLQDLDGELKTFAQNVGKVTRRYDATRGEIDTALADFNSIRVQWRGKLIDTRFEMRAIATPGEWEKLAEKEKNLYKELIQPSLGTAQKR